MNIAHEAKNLFQSLGLSAINLTHALAEQHTARTEVDAATARLVARRDALRDEAARLVKESKARGECGDNADTRAAKLAELLAGDTEGKAAQDALTKASEELTDASRDVERLQVGFSSQKAQARILVALLESGATSPSIEQAPDNLFSRADVLTI